MDDYQPNPALIHIDTICKAIRATPPGGEKTIDFDIEEVRKVIARHIGSMRHHYSVRPSTDGKATVVLRANRTAPEPTRRGGRPPGQQSARAQLAAIQLGATVTIYGLQRASLQVETSRMKRSGLGAFRLAQSELEPDAIRVTRVDNNVITDGYGNNISLADLVERTPYPFRTMKPGDRFTATQDAHSGIANMRSICSRFSDRIGYTFTAKPEADKSITVTCTYRPGVWVSEKRESEVARNLKSKAPQVISEIWE